VTIEEAPEGAGGALLAALVDLAALHPRGRTVECPDGTTVLTTGAPMPTLNGIFALRPQPDPAQLEPLAALLGAEPVPWSLVVRGEPGPGIVAVGAAWGHTDRRQVPLLECHRDNVRWQGTGTGAPAIRLVGSAEAPWYAELLDAGFEAPTGTFASLLFDGFFDVTWRNAYVAEAGGVAVGIGYGIRVGAYIGVANVAVLPRFRGRGYGRLITERVLSDGFGSGATSAYLQASPDGRPLYESMGFRFVEQWTYLVRPER
jgi:GNAT superfamily N-acetyltransferase